MLLSNTLAQSLHDVPIPRLLYIFQSAPSRVKQVMEGLQERELKHTPRTGKWSIFQIVIHLVDAEIVGAMRIRQAYTQSNRKLADFDQDIWADCLDYQSLDMAAFYQHVKLFDLLRTTTVGIFQKASESDWEKTVVHPRLGFMTLRHLLEAYAAHSENHIAQIVECRHLMDTPLNIPMLLEDAQYR